MASRRFRAGVEKSLEDLSATMARMRATARIDFGGRVWREDTIHLLRNGIDWHDNTTGIAENGVRITFWRDGKGYAYESDAFPERDDNIRACQRAITELYRVFEDYKVRKVGVGSFDALFGGFLLLGDGRREWWEILGVPQDAQKREVTRAYRKKVRETHPDRGGSEESFKLVSDAYDQAMASFGR